MTDGAGKPPTNPYIGARPFRRNEKIYGRAREARDLLSLLVGDRIVLLNSPSGAGKTSLIQAALVPTLERRRFAVRPTIRVGAVSPVPGANRYLLSVMQSLEDARPAAEQLPPEDLARLSLDTYLSQRSRQGAENGQVLIFDQFEEVLTLDPSDEPARVAFFEQLGDALADPWRWALFAIREEYVAALEHYANLVPTRFANTFRLELLGVEAAAEAICGPAQSRGVGFAEGVAEALAGDLAKIVVQDAEGRAVERTGTSVEPVQLQVVCYRLWERRFAAGGEQVPGQTISAADVRAIGSIDNALEEYYASGVAQAAAASQVGERAVRSWVDTQLITRQGFRSQVLADNEASFGLNEATVDGLTNAYLVREERRRGVTWLELAHDRLIAPVRASNARWFAEHLSPLQRQAEIWAAQGQSPSLLFRDTDLADAEAWATANAAGLTDDERLFLENCREERRRAEERARTARRIRNLAIGASVAAVAALIAFVTAFRFFTQANDNYQKAATAEAVAVAARATSDANYLRAEAQRATAESSSRVSTAREIAAASLNRIDADPELAVLLGIQAVQATEADDPEVSEAVDALQQAVSAARLTQTITLTDTNVIYQVAYSADGRYLAAAAGPGAVRVWKRAALLSLYRTLPPEGEIYAAAFDPRSPTLAIGGSSAKLWLWDVEGDKPPRESATYDGAITQIAYSPDGRSIGLAGAANEVIILDSATLDVRLRLSHDEIVPRLAFSADGRIVATASWDKLVKVWDAQTGALLKILPHTDNLTSVAFSPDGTGLISGSSGSDVFVWDLTASAPVGEPEQPIAQLRGHSGSVFVTAFSAEGMWLASTGADSQVRLWNVAAQKTVAILSGHHNMVLGLAYSPDSSEAATVSQDVTLRIWRLDFLHPDPVTDLMFDPRARLIVGDAGGRTIVWDAGSGTRQLSLERQPQEIARVAVSSRGDWIATGSTDGSIKIWDAATGTQIGAALIQAARVDGLAFSADGTQIAAVGGDNVVRRWDLASGTPLDPLGAHDPAVQVAAVAFSPDGQFAASGDSYGVVHVWDLRTGKDVLGALKQTDGEVRRLVFSPDSQYLAVSDVSNNPVIYDLKDTSQPWVLQRHSSPVNQVAFSPDGTRIVSASQDLTIRLWDMASREQLQVWRLPKTATPTSVAFSPDGSRLAVAGSDGVVRLIPIQIDDLLAMARQRVSREQLTDDECETYLHQSAGCATAP